MPKGNYTKTKESIVPLRGVVRGGKLSALLDQEGNEIGMPVTAVESVNGGIGNSAGFEASDFDEPTAYVGSLAKYCGIVAGQSLAAYLFSRGTPTGGLEMAKYLRTELGFSSPRTVASWGASGFIHDGSSQNSVDYTVKLVNAASNGSALLDVSLPTEVNPATSSNPGSSNYWYNTQDNAAISSGGALDATPYSPGPLWRSLMTKIAACDTVGGFHWSQGTSDATYIGTGAANRALYKSVLKLLFQSVRDAVGDQSLPIFIHRNGRHNTAADTGQQYLRDLQREVCDEMKNVFICAEEYDVRLCAAAAINNATTANGSPTISLASTSGLTAGKVITGPGIPYNSWITSVVANTSITLNRSATAGGTVTLYRMDDVHPYPGAIEPVDVDTNGDTVLDAHNRIDGFYAIARRAATSIKRALNAIARGRQLIHKDFGPKIVGILATPGSADILLKVRHDKGRRLTTLSGAVSAASAFAFRVEVNAVSATISNVTAVADDLIKLTLSAPVPAGATVAGWYAYGAMNKAPYLDYIRDDAWPVPMPLQPASPTITPALSITI